MRYLLDTNIISALLKQPLGRVLQKVEAVGEEQVYTSIIVAAELRFGAVKKGSSRLSAEIHALLSRMPISPLAPPIDGFYADLRTQLEARGELISANDLLIACQAIQDGSVVVTDNVREFGRVPGLTVENWLR
jgi:tRNA(fMet)-specific endonuclease VapC